MNTESGPLPRGWGLFACLLGGLLASPLALAQGQQGCSAQSFNGLQVQPAAGQTLLEFNAGSDYQPYTVALRANKSLPTGGSYTWKQVNATPPLEPVPPALAVALDTTDQARPTFQTRDFGPGGATLTFQVTAKCGTTAVASATGSITIQNVDRPPVVIASANPPIANAGDGVTLAASASDPDGDAIAYQWVQVANGAPAATLDAPGAATTGFVAPAAPGDYTLEFKITASSNALSSSDTVLVNVSAVNLPPQASLACTDPVDEGAPLLLDGSASYDPEGGPLTYAWSVDAAPAGLDLVLDHEAGATVQRNAPILGEGMDGAVVVRLRVDDGTQYTDATCAFMIHDATAPQLQLPADLLLDADSAAGTQVSAYAVSAVDNVDGDIGYKVACTPAAPHVFPLATTTVDCSVADTSGNAAQGAFHVTVTDQSPPLIAPHGDVALEATGPQTDVPYDLPATSDKVDGAGVASCDPPPGPFGVDSTIVTCNATDHAGNAATPTQFTVTVHDHTAPALTLPADMTVEATSHDGAVATWVAGANDLVDGSVPVSCDPASGATFALGAHAVACSATDAHGNTAQGGFQVSVVDTTAPAMSPDPLPDVTVTATGNSAAVVDFAMPSAWDIVDGARPVSCSAQPGASFNVGATVVTCSASDETGNTVTRSFTVRVNYAFAGFFQPIDMGAINTAKAGSAIPVKFSLGGNQGMSIFAANSPASGAVACDMQATTDEIETTLTAGGSSLQYDATSGQYIYVWKTERSWQGCRVLKVTLRDGSVRTAMFKFR